jgi:hypothetical protein
MIRYGEKDFFKLLCLYSWIFLMLSACSHKVVKETEYSPGERVAYESTVVDEKVIKELRRLFDQKIIEGNGIFESDNEGLARRTAINLAVAELAGQVQTIVRAEIVIYNDKEVRDVVENRVQAVVSNYQIESAGYDSGTNKYRVRVSISGETVRQMIEKQLK